LANSEGCDDEEVAGVEPNIEDIAQSVVATPSGDRDLLYVAYEERREASTL